MYSHDTFGLGHLRRCRTIAHYLVEHFRGLHVLIISGSPIAGAFDFRARVEFVKIPSVIKESGGEYVSHNRHIDLDEAMQMRQSMIRQTAETFQPDIVIVDKEPLGLDGELEETLSYLKTRGATLVLGLRDVMDSPGLLAREWTQRDVLRKIGTLYDMIWVYGPADFWDPLSGLDVPVAVRRRMNFVGFLHRAVPTSPVSNHEPHGDYILVTVGGGGDGADLIDNVLSVYQRDAAMPYRALVVMGPFMPADRREVLWAKAKTIPAIDIIQFDSRLETLIAGARAVVGMGGYNTFCEVLSFDKPALLVPRVAPREEQLVRAKRGAELGLVDMLLPEEAARPELFAGMLRKLSGRPAPSQRGRTFLLDGLPNIKSTVEDWISERPQQRLSVIEATI
jgi:predicted glycosyltransferase